MSIFSLAYKSVRKCVGIVWGGVNQLKVRCLFAANDITYSSFRTNGVPYIMVARGGRCFIGRNFMMNNGIKGNPIGCYERCTFFVDRGAVLTIGDNVGISQAALVCHRSITIGNDVKIGAGSVVTKSVPPNQIWAGNPARFIREI